jgi:error-prone DNA polymerase
VPLFQEQIMKIAITLAGFTPGEADQLRRAIGAWRSTGSISAMGQKLMQGLLSHGLPQTFADQIFEQIQGFAEYGFPESHAASFALIAYASAWLKCHHPAEFAASIINSQPMGFYSNATLIEDARRHGVRILPVCVRESVWDCRAGPGSIRLGFRIVQGMQRNEYEKLALAREQKPFQSIADFSQRVNIRRPILHQMAMGGVLDSFGLARREALWAVLGCEANRVGELFQAAEQPPQLNLELPGLFAPLSRWESIDQDVRTTGVFTSGHPVEELRRQNPGLPQITTREAKLKQQSRKLSVFGLVIVMQRPPTAKGTCFATLEDGEGFLDLIIRKEVFERSRELFESRSFLKVTGKLQRSGGRESHSASLLVDTIE